MIKIIRRRMMVSAVLSSIFIQPGMAMEAPENLKAAPLLPQLMISEKPDAFKSKADEIEAAAPGNLSEGNGLPMKAPLDTEKSKFKTLLLQATAGNLQAQVDLAKSYQEGNLVAQNLDKAMLWYHRATEKNYPEAQYKMGKFYHKGLGVEVNLKEAVAWYQQAADQGHTRAQYYLGLFYHNGYGVDRNLKKAVEYYFLSNIPKANEGLCKIIGSLKNAGEANEQKFLKDINHFTGLAEYLIAKNGLKAELNRPGFGAGRIDNPDQAAFHQSLVDFGSRVLRVLKSFNEPGFMVNFEEMQERYLYIPNNLPLFFKTYFSLDSLACLGEKAIISGDLLYGLLYYSGSSTPGNYNYIHTKIKEAIEVEKKAIKDFKAKIVKLDKLIQIIKAEIAGDPLTQQRELLQAAEKEGILAESIKPSLTEIALQEITEVKPKKLIHYLSQKTLFKKVIDKCYSSFRFLNKQLRIIENIKNGLLNVLKNSIHLRNKKLASIRPGLSIK